MLNSILLLGSYYNKHKRISMIFTIAMILNIILVRFGHVKIGFFIYNILIMIIVSLTNNRIKNNSLKLVPSTFSILI